ncbi:MAG: hypothetical protein KDB14_19970 [Planctomycetales bacterium]|nr:hypothetical protein [Planctomycetales bacterium]
MDQINKQVARVRTRLNFDRFVHVLGWAVFSCLLIAAVAAGTRILLGVADASERWYFALAGLGAGVLLATVLTYWRRRETMDAAIELDRRFQLKERISSSLSLSAADRETEAGQALIADATRRAERIEVSEHFKIQPNASVAMPLLGLTLFFALAALPNLSDKTAQAAANEQIAKEQIRKPAEDLKKKIEQRKQEAAEKGLTDASELLKKVSEDLDKVASGDVQKKEALVKLNDIANEIAERRKQLGGADEMKKQLENLKNIKSGPADKMQKAMEQGDFEAAMDAMNDLKEKLADGKLSDEEKKDLADQLKQMSEKLQDMQNERERRKQELKEQIEQRRQAGDTEAAEKLQQQLDAMEASDQESSMDLLKQLADKLGQASENLQEGDGEMAMENLDDLLDQLQDMQDALDELQELDSVMDELEGAKGQMLGQYGMGNGQGMEGNGNGNGEGQGEGERGLEETETGTFDSAVRGKVQKGAAIRTGVADGPNRKTPSRESVKEEIQMSISERSDAVNDQRRLPKDQRDHLREYFRNFNE